MLALSAIAKEEKNKIDSDSVFILLLELDMPIDGVEPIRVCYNTEDITWNGHLWQAFPMEIAESEEDSTGSYPSFTIKIDNISKALTYYVEKSNGGKGGKVTLYVVNTKAIENSTPEVEERYEIKKTYVNEQWISVTVGSSYSTNSRRPAGRYLKNGCRFVYKGKQCRCTSTLPTCNHSLADCRQRGNKERYGGFPGVDMKGVYA
ncbi:DUF1833 family protein [Megasphaera elsdenii]|jgi:phage-related protein|uniref:DUF1833 family protein n=1 Tax=Megasphaera elsdenii TaxID=907 RepID=UPI002A818D1D|nr:DUF1833 family protein [Megasphaera elsdenii]MCI7200436.1 DUF1833 family protein [Megasphaera elsdenii]MDY4265551.1 DUF1833 family protein [Megasphaera elsdenii]